LPPREMKFRRGVSRDIAINDAARVNAAIHSPTHANATIGASRADDPRGTGRVNDPHGFGRDPSDLGDF
jgi:hypothetical protein